MTATPLFGIDRFLTDPDLRRPLLGKRIALLAHPASVTADLTHSLDALAALPDIRLTAAFGPQHGLKGDKQDNMVESADFLDPQYGIPVFSLYGEVRRPTAAMLDTFDVLLVDLQDLGCRIYTFITTLRYVLEAAAGSGKGDGKAVWVLDRPNPAGRPVEGFTLRPGWESFVGAGTLPMRHGLTLGELGHWFIHRLQLDVDYRVIAMQGWQPDAAPGYGWPLGERAWINPSPNAPNLSMARAYAGTVMLEGTTLSEGRGTTRPLEFLFGAPDLDARAILADMQRLAPDWLAGCKLRECWFEPTVHKFHGQLCHALQVHCDGPHYRHHAFKPWRLQALAFKAIRRLYPDYPLWRDFGYEYEFERLAIDLINGSPLLREWVDDPETAPVDLERAVAVDENAWQEQRASFLIY
ncbi:MAG: exo-beta-N-acetylmuramidase NamZ domain-containing protein [Azonexus sp.]